MKPPPPRSITTVAACACAAALAVTLACGARDGTVARRTLYFAGEPVARVEERVSGGGGERRVTRTVVLEESGDTSELVATIDAQGFALSARYTRGTLRRIELADLAALAVATGPPVVLIDLLGAVQPLAPTAVLLVDLASAEVLTGSVERRGAEIVALDAFRAVVARANVEGHRTGPGVFFEGDSVPATARAPVHIEAANPAGVRAWRLVGIGDTVAALAADGPGQRRVGDVVVRAADATLTPAPSSAVAPQPFIESTDTRVLAWASALAAGDDPMARAARLVEAIHPLVDGAKGALPPGALVMLERGGDCDGAAALLTAGLRALGTPARPVVGYRWVEGRFLPHAWTEVWTPAGWLVADATVPRIGDDPSYLKLFEGLGGALTMGRVLGRLQVQPTTAPGAP